MLAGLALAAIVMVAVVLTAHRARRDDDDDDGPGGLRRVRIRVDEGRHQNFRGPR